MSEEKASSEKPHLSVVFIGIELLSTILGHVDAGKSTLCGQILFQSGQVDEQTVRQYQKLAKDKKRDSWWVAYIMDLDEEERAKGKTVEVGYAYFETDKHRYTILDAPGHKNYVPAMVQGASQADVGVLVISARTGEFEAGFNKGGQTQEHAILAKTLGVKRLVVVVNKMDTCKWDKERFDMIKSKISDYCKKINFKNPPFVPISAIDGEGLFKRNTKYYNKSKTLIETLDSLKAIKRKVETAFRLAISDGRSYNGLPTVIGRIISGSLEVGQKIKILPDGIVATVANLEVSEESVQKASAGENVFIGLASNNELKKYKGAMSKLRGNVICAPEDQVEVTTDIEADISILNLPPGKPLVSKGYRPVMHIHAEQIECVVTKIIAELDNRMKVVKEKPKFLRKNANGRVRIQLSKPVALESFANNKQLGQFTWRDHGITVGIGRVQNVLHRKKKD